jgi:DNA invertase Pin-like site-specific DNA recombinase
MENKHFAYLRVSTPQQAQDSRHGFSRQLQTIHSYCQNRGITCSHVFSETWTGKDTRRPEWLKMLKSLNDGDTVVVESMDRFSRDGFSGFSMLMDLLSLNVDLVDCSTGESLKESLNGHPMKKFLVQVRLLVSELEKDLVCHRLYKGRQASAKKNGGKFTSGQPMFYDSKFRQRVRRLLRTRTAQEVADRLNEEGCPSRSGKPWSAHMVAGLNRKP